MSVPTPAALGRFPATLEAVRNIAGLVMGALPPGADPLRVGELELGVVEAATNIVKHGCADVGCTEIEVEVRLDGDGVTITLRDYAQAFDPTAFIPALPDFEADDVTTLPESGMGIALMHTVFDSVTYARVGGANELSLHKAL